jgi:hypothetical protein
VVDGLAAVAAAGPANSTCGIEGGVGGRRERLRATGVVYGPYTTTNNPTRASDPVDALILDLLAWLGPEPRPYAEVLEAWRTSCPRLPVWETATERGLISRGRGATVSVSAAGVAYLAQRGADHVHPHARADLPERGRVERV